MSETSMYLLSYRKKRITVAATGPLDAMHIAAKILDLPRDPDTWKVRKVRR